MFTLFIAALTAWGALALKEYVAATMEFDEVRWQDAIREPLELALDIWTLWGWRPETAAPAYDPDEDDLA